MLMLCVVLKSRHEMSRSLTHSPAASVPSSRQPSATAMLVDRDAGLPLYQALSDHTPNHDGELTISVGDIITSVRQLGNGWALGRNASAPDRPVGIFPVACVVAVTATPPRPAAECRRCGGSLPAPRPQPAPERGPKYGRYSGHWDRSSMADADAGAPPRDTEDPRGDIELLPHPSHTESPPQPTPSAEESGDVDKSPARLPLPVENAVDSPPTIPRRQVPKPHLVVKPTRDQPAPVNEYATPSKSPGWGSVDAAAARMGSPGWGKPAAHRSEGDDDGRRWCGIHRSSRGPPPPPPARALSTFVGRSDPTLRQTVLTASSPHSVGDPTDSRCGCIDSLGITRRHAVAAVRSRRCHSGVPTPSAAVNGSSPSAADVSFGVAGVLRPGRPILKSRTPRVADSVLPLRPGNRRQASSSLAASRLSVWSVLCRLIGSMVTGILLGVFIFAVLFYDQSCDVYTSLVAGFAVAVVVALALGVSRLCRCVVALLPVSLSTARGRLALCLLVFSVLLAGPVLNVHRNAGEAVRSLTCSAELALNRTASLLRPFDAMMSQLDRTVSRLEGAAADVAQGLKPLDEGLDAVKMNVKNARTQLLGTRRVSYVTLLACLLTITRHCINSTFQQYQTKKNCSRCVEVHSKKKLKIANILVPNSNMSFFAKKLFRNS